MINLLNKFHVFVLIFVVFIKIIKTHQQNNVINVKVWGPGLKPGFITMPARYFFVHILDDANLLSNNNNNDKDFIAVQIQGTTSSSRSCRIWTNVLNCKRGCYIVRYKLYETCDSLNISVKYKQEDIRESPFIVKGLVNSDDCNCPKADVDEFLSTWGCGNVPNQIIKDLNIFDKIDWESMRQKIISQYNSPNAVSLCHYVVKTNKIHRKCYGQYVGFKVFMDNILLSLSRKVYLPDLEFFVNLGDWPLVKSIDLAYPIFSWCGSKDTFDIVMPTYDITESTLENMGRVMLDMLSVQGNVDLDWEQKIPKVFWRGRDSNRFRLKLINISREYPDLFNVSMTNFFFFRNEEDLYGPKAEHESFFKFFNYKYQLNIDGTVAAYRFPYLLAGGSLVFKQDSKYYEHFYNDLLPNVHYVPIKEDLSDLIEKINWAKNNDEMTKQIAMNSRKFANEHLLPKNIFCYYTHLLVAFKRKIVSKVNVLNDMDEVAQVAQPTHCKCLSKVKEEL